MVSTQVIGMLTPGCRHRTQVYRATTEGIIRKVMGGFNGTVFAYGQTSSGKTHTMLGTAVEPGILPLAVRAIFDHIEATQDREFLLRVSYMEVRRSCTSLQTSAMMPVSTLLCNNRTANVSTARGAQIRSVLRLGGCGVDIVSGTADEAHRPVVYEPAQPHTCGVLQMYNEEVNDLLAPENKKLQVHESREQGVYVAGLREDIVTSATQA